MKVLVSAASKHGATDEIACAIATVLAERGIDVDVRSPQAVIDPVGYDAIVLGSAIYAGRWLKPARSLAHRIGRAADRPVWLFSSGPIGDPPKPDEDPADADALSAATKAREHRVFEGKLDTRQLGLAERTIVRALKINDGDYRDFERVSEWAGEIADALLAPARI